MLKLTKPKKSKQTNNIHMLYAKKKSIWGYNFKNKMKTLKKFSSSIALVTFLVFSGQCSRHKGQSKYRTFSSLQNVPLDSTALCITLLFLIKCQTFKKGKGIFPPLTLPNFNLQRYPMRKCSENWFLKVKITLSPDDLLHFLLP